jgi:hypothetical protein
MAWYCVPFGNLGVATGDFGFGEELVVFFVSFSLEGSSFFFVAGEFEYF